MKKVIPSNRRQFDATAVAIALITGICAAAPATILAWRTNVKVDEVSEKVEKVADKVEVVHKATNSLTDRLVESTKSDSLQQGRTEGRQEEKDSRRDRERLPNHYVPR